MNPILTAKTGTNADLFPDILELYVPKGSRVLDMTYGKGVFWKNVDQSEYDLVRNDIDPERGDLSHDFSEPFPFPDDTFDAVVFDPPYKLTGTKYKKDRYGNLSRGRKRVWDFYVDGMKEAVRLLRTEGMMIVKCMDQVSLHKQNWMSVFVFNRAEKLGMTAEDLFILVRPNARAQPHDYQKHAWKNHSFFWVFRNGGKSLI